MSFSLLVNRNIIDVLIGNTKVYEDYSLPYLSGPQLCELSTSFGLPKNYVWKGANQSRWEYMQDLLKFLDRQNRVSELLAHLMDMKRFSELTSLKDPELIQCTYDAIAKGAIDAINANLLLSRKELRCIRGMFAIVDIGAELVFKTAKVKVVNLQYIRELPQRIEEDIKSNDYDSVITKSRTLLEEVLIYIIERLTKERYKSSGDLNKIYQEVTELLNMRQQKEWDKRVNSLLGGLHKIVDSISSMRNMNSDAHGVGAGRIGIKEREAVLVANASMMLAEYWLSVFEKKN